MFYKSTTVDDQYQLVPCLLAEESFHLIKLKWDDQFDNQKALSFMFAKNKKESSESCMEMNLLSKPALDFANSDWGQAAARYMCAVIR
jgi:leucyl-tRNA synthetase